MWVGHGIQGGFRVWGLRVVISLPGGLGDFGMLKGLKEGARKVELASRRFSWGFRLCDAGFRAPDRT